MKPFFFTLLIQTICLISLNAQDRVKPTKTNTLNNSCSTSINLCQAFSSNNYSLSPFISKTVTSITNSSTCYNVGNSPSYGCLSTSLNQHWYIFKANSVGNISFEFSSSNSTDIDGAIYSLNSSDLSGFCSALQSSPLSCDYSSSSTINLSFNNSTIGKYYILLITNYGNYPCLFTVSQPTSGQVDLFDIITAPTPPPSTLAACYSFENSLKDSVTLSTGSPNGSITYGTDRNGRMNSAVYLNGYSKIDIPTANLINTSYTYSVWFNLEQIPPSNSFLPLVSIGGSGGDQHLGLVRDYLTYNSSGLVYPSVGSYYQYSESEAHFHPSSIETNKWYNLVSVKKTDSLIIYLDGVELSRRYNPRTPYYSSYSGTLGGRTSNTFQYFKGKIDDVMLFKAALNKDQIASLYYLNNCQYNSAPCEAYVNVSGNYEGTTKQASVKLVATNAKIQSGSNEFSAGKSITLNPGFEVNQGAVFKTRIGGCR